MNVQFALYQSDDKKDEEYWDVAETEKKYNVKINDTKNVNWGGQNIYDVEGEEADLEYFAIDFTGAVSLQDVIEEEN